MIDAMKKLKKIKINYHKLKHGLIISMMVSGLFIFLFNYHIPSYNINGKHSNIYGGQEYGFKSGEEKIVHFVLHLFG